jgi:hypothetical protein
MTAGKGRMSQKKGAISRALRFADEAKNYQMITR